MCSRIMSELIIIIYAENINKPVALRIDKETIEKNTKYFTDLLYWFLSPNICLFEVDSVFIDIF